METLEQIKARHSKEKKDLQGRITSKKKSANKKNRKGVNAECDELELSLRLKQEQELSTLSGEGPIPDIEDASAAEDNDIAEAQHTPEAVAVNSLTSSLAGAKLDDVNGDDTSDTASTGPGGPKKKNRQKERLARRAAEQEAASLEAEKEAAKLPNWKRQERTGMLAAFKEHNLIEEEIRPDGHCLFSAVADQLQQIGIPASQAGEPGGYKAVRKAAADYIESHADDFEGFMEEPLKIHTYKIRETAEWGGHLEVTALARSYGVEIKVVQNERVDSFVPGEGEVVEEGRRIWLAYYLHGYGLGEHYNSLRKAP